MDTTQAQAAETTTTPTPPPVETPPSPPPAAKPEPAALTIASDDELFGAPVAATPEAAPAPEPTVEPTPEVPAGDTPPAPEEPKPEPETPKQDTPADEIPNRIRTNRFTPKEKRALALQTRLKEGEVNITFTEALGRIDIEDREASETASKAAQSEPEVASDPVSVLDRQIAEIDGKLDAFDDGALITGDFKSLTAKRAELVADRAVAKIEAKQQAQATQKQQAVERKAFFEPAKQQAKVEFPTIGNPESPFFKAVSEEVSARSDPAHELHHTLADADAPLVIAREVAERHAAQIEKDYGIPKAQAIAALRGNKPNPAPAPAAVAKPAEPPPPAARPAGEKNLAVTGNQAPATPAPKATTQELNKQMISDPHFNYDAVLEFAPNPFGAS